MKPLPDHFADFDCNTVKTFREFIQSGSISIAVQCSMKLGKGLHTVSLWWTFVGGRQEREVFKNYLVLFFQACNRHTKQKKNWCHSELLIGKGLSKLPIALGKMADFREQRTCFIWSQKLFITVSW